MEQIRHGGPRLLLLWIADESAKELRCEREPTGPETRRCFARQSVPGGACGLVTGHTVQFREQQFTMG